MRRFVRTSFPPSDTIPAPPPSEPRFEPSLILERSLSRDSRLPAADAHPCAHIVHVSACQLCVEQRFSSLPQPALRGARPARDASGLTGRSAFVEGRLEDR